MCNISQVLYHFYPITKSYKYVIIDTCSDIMKYYAVKKGRHPGIYNTWEECQKEVDHFKDAKFKSFDSKKEALAYLKQNNQKSSLHSKQETTNQRKQNKDKISLSKDQYKAYQRKRQIK